MAPEAFPPSSTGLGPLPGTVQVTWGGLLCSVCEQPDGGLEAWRPGGPTNSPVRSSGCDQDLGAGDHEGQSKHMHLVTCGSCLGTYVHVTLSPKAALATAGLWRALSTGHPGTGVAGSRLALDSAWGTRGMSPEHRHECGEQERARVTP